VGTSLRCGSWSPRSGWVESIGFPFNRDTDTALDWSKADANSGIVQLYSDLVHLRRNASGNTRGLEGNNVNVFHANNDAKVVAFHRWMNGAGDDVVVVANFSANAFPAYDIGLPRGGTWHVRFNSDWSGYSSEFGDQASDDAVAVGGKDGLSFHGTVGIGA